jgi:hypothetical protein
MLCRRPGRGRAALRAGAARRGKPLIAFAIACAALAILASASSSVTASAKSSALLMGLPKKIAFACRLAITHQSNRIGEAGLQNLSKRKAIPEFDDGRIHSLNIRVLKNARTHKKARLPGPFCL